MANTPLDFLREVRQEASKITWPTRRDTLATTGMVFVFVVIAAVFFLLVDKAIAFAVQLLLGVA